MKRRTQLMLAGCLALMPTLALAEDARQSPLERPYFQIGAGGQIGSGENFFLLKLAGGVPLTRTFGVELGYSTIGNIFFADVDIFYLSAVARLPIGKNSALAGKLGIAHWKSDLEPLSLQSGSDSGTNAMLGLDWEYAMFRDIALVLSLEHYGSVNVGTAGGDKGTRSGVVSLRYLF